MYQDKYFFAQLVSFLNRSKFNRIVAKFNGDKYVKHFTCWNQLLSLMFGQLSNRESLRDLIVALDLHHPKSYHLGLGRNILKSSLARANQDRDYPIFDAKLISLTKVGEEVNRLNDIYNNLSQQYSSEVEFQLKKINTLLEPFIIVVIGGLVALILISMYLPMFKMSNSVF